MEPPFTPRQSKQELEPASSSVFMTPPLSDQKPTSSTAAAAAAAAARSRASRPTQLPPLSLLSPALTPPAVARGFRAEMSFSPDEVDVLARLYLEGHRLVLDEVLSYLSPADLASSLQVSRTWNELITSDARLAEMVAEHRRRRKENAENLGKPFAAPSSTAAVAAPGENRRALSSIAANVLARPAPAAVPSSSSQPVVHHSSRREGGRTMLPCPNCRGSARQLNLRRAECGKCAFDYCLHCFKPWHGGDCSKRSAEKASRDAIAGTKKSKKRLRRL